MTAPVIVRPLVKERFEKTMEHGRVLLISAPCGFGKSTLADALLSGRSVCRRSAGDPGFILPAADADWDVLLLDDLQLLQENDRQALCELIRTEPGRRFVLLTRGAQPGWLAAFQYAGVMNVLDADELLFDREDIRRLFDSCGVPVTDADVNGILKESIGYPLGVVITEKLMAGGKPFGPAVVAQAFHEVFLYFETAVYLHFDLPIRRFLLELAPFESFDLEMARMVSGDNNAGALLDWLRRNTTMIRCDDIRRFRFWPQFRSFLLWEMDREYTDEKRCALFSRGGLYYELREDYPHALDCYARSGDHSKVSELLIRNAELHPGMGHYGEMEKYYRSLPEEEILASPALMQGMSMLCALSMDYEGSERWYRALVAFADRCARQDAARIQAHSRIAWLDISLPQRGVGSLIETIPTVFRLMRERKLRLPAFSVTSSLPSIMNGGKDFSDWSKKDDFLYKTLRTPVEAVLGRDGVCLADCAIAESKFEKGGDITARMLALMPRLVEIQRSGTPDIEFAAVGLLVRSQLDTGNAADARRTLETLRARFADEDAKRRFLPNIDAMLCRIALHMGDLDAADAWYREKAPRDTLSIHVMLRYRYVTQAMVELAENRPDAALLTLAPMETYCRECARHIDGIHLHVLRAIALRRQKKETWRVELAQALTEAAEYEFIRTLSGYGAALLPLLEEWDAADAERHWFRRMLAAVRMQAANYPDFLRPLLPPGEALTATELQVLRLMCADKSNAEIGAILNIKLATVKTHVSHILDKLGVSRRGEAKTAAQKLWLLPREP